MTGKNGAQGVDAEVSTGGSLISDSKLQSLYTGMLHCRMLAEYAAGVRLSEGAVNPFAASLGQEATAAGWVTDLQPEDTLAVAGDDLAPSLIKGVPLEDLMAPLHGHLHGAAAGSMQNVIAPSSNVQEQFAAFCSAAIAAKRKKKRPVVVAFIPAATTSLPAWHELLTKATKLKLPIVLVVENNPWIAPAAAGAEDDDFTQKARHYGLPGISVDGNDVVAVYRVAFESLARLRQGDGPFLVEARTYSEAGRSKRRFERDPLVHMERYLKAKKLFEKKWKDQLMDAFRKELAEAARKVTA